jgi:acyl dehydratase
MERPDGELVAGGTASVGAPTEPTHLEQVDLRPGDPDALRILAGVRPGDRLPGHEIALDPRHLVARIEAGALTEPIDWYTGGSPWGGPVANPSTVVQLLRNRPGDFGPHVGQAVGLFGAIEVRHHHGPVLFGERYRVDGEVVAVGSSPRTEYVWYDTRATDQGGQVVASMRMQLRWMTASSPLYAER